MPDVRIIVIDSSAALMPAALALRHEVFVIEQGVAPELERDDFDGRAIHLIALCDDEVVGTLRIVTSERVARIGRMAVRQSARGRGVGSRLMNSAEAVAAQLGVTTIVLHAQLTAEAFYRRLGYQEEGENFDEAGIPHVSMRKSVAALPPSAAGD